MKEGRRNRMLVTVLSIPLILIFIIFGPPYYEGLGILEKSVFMSVFSLVFLLLLYYIIGERIMYEWVNKMGKYNCPECGGSAPESGGVYNKSYSPEENDMVYFWFPIYMCVECELEFVINGVKIVNGKLIWQDKNVKRENYDDS